MIDYSTSSNVSSSSSSFVTVFIVISVIVVISCTCTGSGSRIRASKLVLNAKIKRLFVHNYLLNRTHNEVVLLLKVFCFYDRDGFGWDLKILIVTVNVKLSLDFTLIWYVNRVSSLDIAYFFEYLLVCQNIDISTQAFQDQLVFRLAWFNFDNLFIITLSKPTKLN